MRLFVTIVFLILSCNIYSQELGILLKSKQETMEILNEKFSDLIPRKFVSMGDTTIGLALTHNTFFFFRYKNNYCYHEEFRTRDMKYNADSVNLILMSNFPKDEFGNYYYDIENYRFYYRIIFRENSYKFIKTVRKHGTDKTAND